MADKSVLEMMLSRYETRSGLDRENAIKEVLQEIVLCGLSRSGFFHNAAFYGGSALRIFYQLDRFSEDLDFSLIEPDSDYRLEEYFPAVKNEAASYGLHVDVEEKVKNQYSAIQSAFLKENTKESLLFFYPDGEIYKDIDPKKRIKVKFEVDTHPASGAGFERRYQLLPAPYEIQLFDEASLFAGKIHAVICRSWKNRIKGRDLYDYIFYLSRGAKVNLVYLRNKLADSGYISPEDSCSLDDVKGMLEKRFQSIDFRQAKEDVLPFIRDTGVLDLWSENFFNAVTERLESLEGD